MLQSCAGATIDEAEGSEGTKGMAATESAVEPTERLSIALTAGVLEHWTAGGPFEGVDLRAAILAQVILLTRVLSLRSRVKISFLYLRSTVIIVNNNNTTVNIYRVFDKKEGPDLGERGHSWMCDTGVSKN